MRTELHNGPRSPQSLCGSVVEHRSSKARFLMGTQNLIYQLFYSQKQRMVAGPVGQDGVAVQLVFAREISGLEQELAPIPFPLTMGCTATKEIVHSNRTARVRRRYLFLVVFLAYLKKKHLNAIALLLKITLSYSVAIPFYFRAVPNFFLHSAGSSPLL